uniref:Protein SPT2 homolog n=1 Tax=Anopheles epiroticus TaxID=199890 RepID=A0A182P4E0_9DIPT
MNFHELLNVAKQNALEQQHAAKPKNSGYSAKFSPPKKVTKEKKDLSENIKRFLAKREEEERLKALEKHQKAQELMAKRSGKAKRKIDKMLKVIKSANKSVLEDAADATECALGTESLEDDYGYTSAVASQFFNKLVDKYKNAPEESMFSEAKKRSMSSEELARARARVKDAILKEQEEQHAPRSRKPRTSRVEEGGERNGSTSTSTTTSAGTLGPSLGARRDDPISAPKVEEKPRPAMRKPNVPPPPDFNTLLKLAETKQHEAVKVEVPAEKKREPDRPMTSKERQEYEEQQAFLAMKRLRDRVKQDPNLSDKEKQLKLARLDELRAAGKLPNIPPLPVGKGGRAQQSRPAVAATTTTPTRPAGFKIPKRGESGTGVAAVEPTKATSTTGDKIATTASSSSSSSSTTVKLSKPITNGKAAAPAGGTPKSSTPASSSRTSKSLPAPTAAATSIPKAAPSAMPSMNGKQPASSAAAHKSSSTSSTSASKSKPSTTTQGISGRGSATSTSAIGSNTKHTLAGSGTRLQQSPARPAAQPPPAQKRASATEPVAKTRQFPPPDVQRSAPPMKRPSAMGGGRPYGPGGGGSGAIKKRRIIDSDSEYDSEMDDFIDDGDCEEDYSSAIKEIFGYDKSRYRDDYDDDDDADNMESSYAQQMREEYISKKIGLMEDLEDMRMEEEEKRRKTVKKKGGGGPSKKK